ALPQPATTERPSFNTSQMRRGIVNLLYTAHNIGVNRTAIRESAHAPAWFFRDRGHYNPPMARRSFDDLVQLMMILRGPDGCPWDRQQQLPDLKPYVIEEAYEVVDAIDRDDRAALLEEVGDLLLEAVFIAEITRAEGSFDVYDSITAIHDKLVRRHPHVFGDVEAKDAEQVIVNWERLKSAERKAEQKGVLSGVPRALPALLKASRLTEKAARVGFDWRRAEDVFDKIDEEIAELREAVAAGEKQAIHDEIGDLLFTVANIARKLGVNPEEALQSANRKFQRRFETMERRVHRSGRNIDELSLEEMDRLWDEAKRDEG
ncbi:MAG TPA: nucleoside triphosphate pyrophosphohydrolase, partial [Thermoanaerobaculia bacterium]|nr:nucleoside triphosphate pyrophosphohydrolase [Thermoanaerobaculia bacterium]